MWIGPNEKMLVSTAVWQIQPIRVIPVAVHFKVTTPNYVEVKLAGRSAWVTHGTRRDHAILWLNINGKDVPWTTIHREEVPLWAHEAFARGIAKLEKDLPSES
jgi:hypothetical protein